MIYELRIYRCVPGKLPELKKRFETVILAAWEKHGIRAVGFWTTLIGESNQNFYYLLEWNDLAERERVWNRYLCDPERLKAREESEMAGPIVANISNTMLEPTAFSRMK